MEPWQRVWIDAEAFYTDVHSRINCTDCHAGQAVSDMEAAHEGMVASPATDAIATCGSCHPNIAPHSMESLHTTLQGYDTVLHERSVPENHPALEEMQRNHCTSCHATCGDCHVSQPSNVGGGLLAGHVFVESPPMSQTCTACHGSRVKNEYFGLNEGIASDVHFRARMSCTSCHTGDEIHGVGAEADHRYDGAQSPNCVDCHQDQVGVGSGIEQHEVHGTELLSCQACHSTAYTNCTNCHVEQNEDQMPFYTVEDHFVGFYLGLNPLRSAERPYRYVPLRHVPIDLNSFSFYGENLLPNFDNLPTWVYATPHNIQRITPQNQTCTSCHTNDTVFLTQFLVDEMEWAANQNVMVEGAPPLPQGYVIEPTPTEPTADEGFWGEDTSTAPSGDDAFWGEPPTEAPPASDDDAFWGEDTTTPDESASESDDAFWGN